jgi:hypothetical protein
MKNDRGLYGLDRLLLHALRNADLNVLHSLLNDRLDDRHNDRHQQHN